MRALMRRIGLRYTVGLGLTCALVVILVVIRMLPHSSAAQLAASRGVEVPSVRSEPDDGLDSVGPAPSPVTSPGAGVPAQVAMRFVQAWLHHDGVSQGAWYAAIRPYCTDTLAAAFDGVDPADVPADRITGSSHVIAFATSYVQVEVPVDGGTVVLGLRANDGRWLVDTVDWNPS